MPTESPERGTENAPLSLGADSGTPGIALRPALLHDSDAVADLLWRVRQQSLDCIPAPVHSLEEMRRWMRAVAFVEYDVWLAEATEVLAGFMALRYPDWLEHLYIDSAFTGQGLGSRFVDLAKQELSGGVQLWTFQSNVGARRFYERHGFVPVQWTDGDNEEQATDVRYVFTADP
jgi:GNAT superfamily N-acetyltransferase